MESKDTLPLGGERNTNCKYTPGIVCTIPLQDRPCGKCGWRPSVSKRRLEQIKLKRSQPQEEKPKEEPVLTMTQSELESLIKKMIGDAKNG